MPDATPLQIREVAQQWHAAAVDRIATKEPAVSVADLTRAYNAVKSPFGETMNDIVTASATFELPAGIAALRYGPSAHRLVSVCMALQRHEGDAPFFLSARVAGDVAGLHYTDAAKVLGLFVNDGVLALVSRGAGLKASRYRFTWGQAKSAAATAETTHG